MDLEQYRNYNDAMKKARRAARRHIEGEVSRYNRPFPYFNPWHRFLHIERMDEGFDFYVFDGDQSLVSTVPSNKNILQRLLKRAFQQFSRAPVSMFFRKSDKKFCIRVQPETLRQEENPVLYTIWKETVPYPLKFDDPEHEEQSVEILDKPFLLANQTLGETQDFLLKELEEHIKKADAVRYQAASKLIFGCALVMTFTLAATCLKKEKSHAPVQQETTEEPQLQPAPLPPEDSTTPEEPEPSERQEQLEIEPAPEIRPEPPKLDL